MNKYIVELIGAFFLIFTIGMCVIDPGGAGAMAPLAIGSVLMVMIYAGGHVSGGHFNPAVTLAVTIRGKCTPADAVAYVIVQCIGGAAAAALVMFFKKGATVTPVVLETAPAIIAELLFTFALCYVVLNAATAKANAGNSFYGLAIGFTVLAGAYAVGSVSGGAFNPAVAIGLGVMGIVKWADLWMHLAGEAVGAIAAAIAFKVIVKDQS